jgi:hypothetical protein
VLPSALPVAAPDQTAGKVRTTWVRLSAQGQALPSGPLALYGARIKVEGTVAMYADGRLVHRAQQQGQLWNSLFTPLWVVLDKRADDAPVERNPDSPGTLARGAGGLSSLWLGPPEALRGRYYLRQWLQRELPATLSAAFLVVGIFALLVWIRRRQETDYLLFFNLAAVSFAGHLHYYVGLPILNDWFAWLTVNSLFWLVTVHIYSWPAAPPPAHLADARRGRRDRAGRRADAARWRCCRCWPSTTVLCR